MPDELAEEILRAMLADAATTRGATFETHSAGFSAVVDVGVQWTEEQAAYLQRLQAAVERDTETDPDA